MASKSASILVKIIGDESGLAKSLKSAESKVDGFTGKMDKVGGSMMKVGAGMSAAVTLPIVAMGVSSVKAFAEAESAQAQLDASLKSTGATAWTSSGAIDTLASSMQDKLAIDGDLIKSGASVLLTFTNVQNRVGKGKDIFDRTTHAAADMSTKLGTDLTSANMMLGKALNDPIKGMGVLKKAGVQLSETQQQQVKDFMAVGDIASAQAVILGELETQFGGSAEAASKTAAGGMEALRLKFEDIQEDIGERLIPILGKLGTVLEGGMAIWDRLGSSGQNVVLVIAGIAAAAGPATFMMGGLMRGVSAASTVVDLAVTSWGKLTYAVSAVSQVAATQGVSNFTALSGILRASASSALALAPAIIGVAGAVAIGALAWKNYADNKARVNALTDESVENLGLEANAFKEAEEERNRKTFADKKALDIQTKLGISLDDLSGISVKHGEAVKQVDDIYADYGDNIGQFQHMISKLPPEVQAVANAIVELDGVSDLDRLRFFQAWDEMSQSSVEGMKTFRTELTSMVKESDTLDPKKAEDFLSRISKATTPEQLNAISNEFLGLTTSADGTTGALGELAGAGEEVASEMESAAPGFDTFQSALTASAELANGLTSALDELFGPKLGLEAATSEWEAALDGLNESIKTNGNTLDITNEKGRANRTVLLDNAQASLALMEAEVATGMSAEEAAGRHKMRTENLIDEAVQSGLTEGEVRNLIGTYADVPPDVITKAQFKSLEAMIAAGNLTAAARIYGALTPEARAAFDKTRASADVQALQAELDRLDGRTVSASVRLRVTEAALPGGLWDGLSGKALGGPVRKGQPYIVGENEPELFVPDTNGQILNQKQMAAASASPTPLTMGAPSPAGPTVVNVHFHGPVARDAERWIVEQVENAVAKGTQMPKLKNALR